MADVHPIEKDKYLVTTRSIERIMNALKQWLIFNFAGAMIYGERRRGKSSCIDFIVKYLSKFMGYRIPVVVLRAKTHDGWKESELLNDLLSCLGFQGCESRKTAWKYKTIQDELAVLARRCPTERVVFIVDDAQRFPAKYFHILMSIFNDLRGERGVKLFTLLVGQPELLTKQEGFRLTDKELLGRFMTDTQEFAGIRSEEEVRFVFKRYRTKLFWPKDSGVSYEAHYAPEAVAAGWSLESESERLWRLYCQAREDLQLAVLGDMPMQALTGIAQYILMRFASKPGFCGCDDEQIRRAIKAVGLLDIDSKASVGKKPESDAGGIEAAVVM